MAQPSVAAFFSNRKRAALDDASTIKTRRLVEPVEATAPQHNTLPSTTTDQDVDIDALKGGIRTRSGRTVKLIGVQPTLTSQETAKKKPAKVEPKQQKLVQFIRKGTLSPRKAAPAPATTQDRNENTPKSSQTFASLQNADNVQRGLRTPTKQIIPQDAASPIKHIELAKRGLSFDEVKTKISRSAKMQELKAVLARKAKLEQERKAQEERNRRLREAGPSPSKAKTVQLKEFDTIELEVLTSPLKTFKTPTKLPPPTPDKNELMSPRHTDASKRLIFSPAKNGSPSKLVEPPAYKRYAHLIETSKAGQLPLPYKYRHLLQLFTGVERVVCMFHNRKECITFKKLQPAVQRMLRKNFTEMHLAQIKHIYPDAFIFSQMKMRNFGSVSKADYFQLVISPNVEPQQQPYEIDEDDVIASAQSTSMNPHVMTMRVKKFENILLQRVMREHDKFVRSLNPPIIIDREVTRWHPEFDLESCPEVEMAPLPQPPNVEKYSSAKDILSTARNLFNCATPMERAMDRYEAKLEADRNQAETVKDLPTTSATATATTTAIKDTKVETETSTATPTVKECAPAKPAADATSNLLKGLPQSLIDKIRAKQAAKALDAMTRRPSQDEEATKYSRLPKLACFLRNIFVVERKSVLTLEFIIKKIKIGFQTNLEAREIEAHLKLLAKELPVWMTFLEVRKTMYIKISKDMDINKIFKKLENIANSKTA